MKRLEADDRWRRKGWILSRPSLESEEAVHDCMKAQNNPRSCI